MARTVRAMPPKQDGQAKAQKKADLAKKTKARQATHAAQRCASASAARDFAALPSARSSPSRRALTRPARGAQALEDKTFGLKNKNKSAKVQKCVPGCAASFPPLCAAAALARPCAPIARAR